MFSKYCDSLVPRNRQISPNAERLTSRVIPDAIREIRRVGQVAGKHSHAGQPRWIHLPIAEALLLSSGVELPRYCETLRHRGKRRTATTFHAVINVPGEPDRAWVACAECTSLMMDGVDATYS
jgi:hypothetical protein